MEYLPVIYSRSRSLISLLIRLIDRQGGQSCNYSHVGVISKCGDYVYEAAGGVGTQKIPLREFRLRASKVEEGLFPCVNKEQAYQRLEEELGKPYDTFGVLSLAIPFIGRDWQKEDSWWCSELVAYSSALFEEENSRTIGVAFCWCLTKPK